MKVLILHVYVKMKKNSSACYVLLVVCVNVAFAQFGRPQTVSALKEDTKSSIVVV